jgi:hypothetical protein
MTVKMILLLLIDANRHPQMCLSSTSSQLCEVQARLDVVAYARRPAIATHAATCISPDAPPILQLYCGPSLHPRPTTPYITSVSLPHNLCVIIPASRCTRPSPTGTFSGPDCDPLTTVPPVSPNTGAEAEDVTKSVLMLADQQEPAAPDRNRTRPVRVQQQQQDSISMGYSLET